MYILNVVVRRDLSEEALKPGTVVNLMSSLI
jgi:hypothetical protein